MRSLYTSFLQLFFPEHCAVCGRSGVALCTTCADTIPRSRSIDTATFAVYDYASRIVRDSIRNLKYNRKSESTRLLAQHATPHIATYLHTYNAPYVLVPIPGHNKKKRMRGFNQSELIAKWVADGIKNATVKHLLTKTLFTLPQAHLKRADRLTNVVDTMGCAMKLDPATTYIIIDDVITTGSTVLEARRALRSAGAQHICAVALAHGYAPK